MIKKRIIFLWILGFILYFFLFAAPLGREFYLYPLATLDLDQNNLVNEQLTKDHAVKLGPYFGYVDHNFALSALAKTNQKVAYNDQYYLFYDRTSTEHPIYDKEGLQLSTITSDAVPFVYDKNIYMVNSQTGLITSYNSAGKLLWSYDAGSLITSIDFTANTIVCGLLNGFALFLTTDGEFESEYRASGSRIDAVYGVALSKSGRYAGMVSGLDPQRFILLERGIYGYTPIYTTNLDSALRRSTHVAFSANEQFVSYEEDGLYHTYNINNKKSDFIPIEGSIKSIKQDVFPGFQAIQSQLGDESFLKIISYDGYYPLLMHRYRATEGLISRFKNQIIIGFDDKLMLVERGRGYEKK